MKKAIFLLATLFTTYSCSKVYAEEYTPPLIRWGLTKVDISGNTTTYTCPTPAHTGCQVWRTNADGTKTVQVFIIHPDGSTTSVIIGDMIAAPDNYGEGTYVIDPVTGEKYYSESILN